jgi:hypothetical protein
VIRIQLQRPIECAERAIALTALPRRKPEHEMTPGILGMFLGVEREQLSGLRIVTQAVRGLGLLIRHRLHLRRHGADRGAGGVN